MFATYEIHELDELMTEILEELQEAYNVARERADRAAAAVTNTPSDDADYEVVAERERAFSAHAAEMRGRVRAARRAHADLHEQGGRVRWDDEQQVLLSPSTNDGGIYTVRGWQDDGTEGNGPTRHGAAWWAVRYAADNGRLRLLDGGAAAAARPSAAAAPSAASAPSDADADADDDELLGDVECTWRLGSGRNAPSVMFRTRVRSLRHLVRVLETVHSLAPEDEPQPQPAQPAPQPAAAAAAPGRSAAPSAAPVDDVDDGVGYQAPFVVGGRRVKVHNDVPHVLVGDEWRAMSPSKFGGWFCPWRDSSGEYDKFQLTDALDVARPAKRRR
jgi:hypothetical protein